MNQRLKLSLILTLLVMLTLTFSACDSGETDEAIRRDEPITKEVGEVNEIAEILEKSNEDDEIIIVLEEGNYDQEIQITNDYDFEKITLIAEEEHEAEINAPIYIYNSEKIVIKDMKIAESEGNAINLENSREIIIKNNKIKNNDYFGVLVNDESHAKIVDNTINNNGLVEDYPGVKTENSSNVLIEDNKITNHNNDGVQIYEESSSKIINNEIIENEANGVRINAESHVDLEGNSIKENQIHGILSSNASIIVKENVINNNNQDGIIIEPELTPFDTWDWSEDNDVIIEDNIIKYNNITGIVNWAGNGSVIQNNDIKGRIGISMIDYLKPINISVENNNLNNMLPFFLQDTKENSFNINLLNNYVETTEFNQNELDTYLQDGDVRYNDEEPNYIHLFYLADPEHKNENLVNEIFENNDNQFIPKANTYNINLIDYEEDHTGKIIGRVN